MIQTYKFVNPPLPYAYNALEPYIDTKTMMLHHDRHLQTYIDNLNQLLSALPQFQSLTIGELILYSNAIPEKNRQAILNNAGGIYNHLFYFSILGPPDTYKISSLLSEFINQTFGDFESFKKAFTEAAMSVFGSGYAWLVCNAFGSPQIVTTANQDTPLPLNVYPLLNIDVWEHAYYLKHYNKRIDYINDWFNVINWEQVSNNLSDCLEYIE